MSASSIPEWISAREQGELAKAAINSARSPTTIQVLVDDMPSQFTDREGAKCITLRIVFQHRVSKFGCLEKAISSAFPCVLPELFKRAEDYLDAIERRAAEKAAQDVEYLLSLSQASENSQKTTKGRKAVK